MFYCKYFSTGSNEETKQIEAWNNYINWEKGNPLKVRTFYYCMRIGKKGFKQNGNRPINYKVNMKFLKCNSKYKNIPSHAYYTHRLKV